MQVITKYYEGIKMIKICIFVALSMSSKATISSRLHLRLWQDENFSFKFCGNLERVMSEQGSYRHTEFKPLFDKEEKAKKDF